MTDFHKIASVYQYGTFGDDLVEIKGLLLIQYSIVIPIIQFGRGCPELNLIISFATYEWGFIIIDFHGFSCYN